MIKIVATSVGLLHIICTIVDLLKRHAHFTIKSIDLAHDRIRTYVLLLTLEMYNEL